MDDYDQTLMELGEWRLFEVHGDQPVEAAVGSGAASGDAGRSAIGVSMDRSLDAAIGSGTASEDTGSETGALTGTSPAAPLPSVMPLPNSGPILVYASTQRILTDANLTAGYEISPGTPTKCPLKQENLESCLAMARTKWKRNMGHQQTHNLQFKFPQR